MIIMRKLLFSIALLFMFIATGHSQMWVTGYWGCWAQQGGSNDPRTPGSIDWKTWTHIIHQSTDPSRTQVPDPTHPEAHYFTYGCSGYVEFTTNLRAMIDSAHVHGRKVLLGLGGTGGKVNDFDWIVLNGHLSEYVNSCMNMARTWGYDGFDLDIEPPMASAAGVSRTYDLIRMLSDSAKTLPGGRCISFALPPWNDQWTLRADSALKYIDQFNVMNYDYSLNSQNSVTEHNAPLYPYYCPSTPRRLDQTNNISWQDSMYWSTVHGGGGGLIPKSKLGVGLAFYGYRWRATDICSPGSGVNSTTSYGFIHDQYKTPALAYRYHWDDVAKVPYLAWSDASGMPGGANVAEKFVTFDDTNSIAIKARWAKDNGYGGLMVWALYYEEVGHPLINAVNKGLGGGVITPPRVDTTIIIPPPPPVVSICDTAYQRGYLVGRSSVVCPPPVICPPVVVCPPAILCPPVVICPPPPVCDTVRYFDNGFLMGFNEGVSAGIDMFDSTVIYNEGFSMGYKSFDSSGTFFAGFIQGSLAVAPVHDTVRVYIDGIDPNATYKYFSASLTDSALNVYLKSGAILHYIGTKSSTTGKVSYRGIKP